MVCSSAFFADTSSGDPLHKLFVTDFEDDHCIELLSVCSQKFVEFLCLVNCSWKTVKKESVFAVIFLESIGRDLTNEIIWNEFAFVHIFLSFFAELCSVFDILSEYVTR